MRQFIISGMSCAACSARVEKAVSQLPGVEECSVSLLTNSMGVSGSASDSEIIKAVTDAGYGARVKGKEQAAEDDSLADTETPKLKKRLLWSLIFLIILMYFSMGHTMMHLPVPPFFYENAMAMGLMQFILTIAVMVINQKFFISGFEGIMHRAPNMDTLVALGSSAAFIYSLYSLFAMTGAYMNNDPDLAMAHMHGLYFETAAMILALITVGKMLEARSKGKTTDALKSLMKLAPKSATLIIDGKETVVPIESVKKGDIFAVRPGENIPVDGIITKGGGAVNESALTGESIPVDKSEGDTVSAATINLSGYMECEATRVGEDTTLAQIIKMVSDASATKAPIAKIADRVSGVFVPVVIAIAALTFIVWLAIGKGVGFALARGISVLVISCPCALGLATPVAIMAGSGVGARNGILFKTAASLEETGKITTAVFDKTGTITRGEPEVTDLIPFGIDETALLEAAYTLESKSEHPLAKAIIKEAQKRGISAKDVSDFKIAPGNGLDAVSDGVSLSGGNYSFISTKAEIPSDISDTAQRLAEDGKTPLFFTGGGKLLGIIAVADVIKEDSAAAIAYLKNMGIRVVMLTGDNPKTAAAIGRTAGVDEVIAGVLPDGKESEIQKLSKSGTVAMVGDGINDAPALTRADIGIAVGAGTDVAIDAADVVLMNSSLAEVPAAIRLSRATLKNIKENLFWAFIYNIIGIPLAAGVYSEILGWEMNPMFGAAAMSLSSFCVVTNALRLNFVNIHSSKHDKKIKIKKERKTMEKTIKVEGMMCSHCEGRVQQALEKLPGVESALANHETKSVTVVLSEDVPDGALKKTIEDQGYKVI